ncbi:hypothetical protein GCM10023238_05760 [Streptomyces heliomycini]
MPKEGNDLDPSQGFDRYTPRARNTVMAAHNEAQAAHNAEGLPEHLVLGLLAEPQGLAVEAITEQGVTADAVREAARAALPPAVEDAPELVPYGPAAKKVLALTFREALRLGHHYIGTEHILLALLEHENGEGVLSGLGVTKAATERYVARCWRSTSRPGRRTSPVRRLTGGVVRPPCHTRGMADRWALAPAEDGGVDVAPLGPDGLPAGPVLREADPAEAVRSRPGVTRWVWRSTAEV